MYGEQCDLNIMDIIYSYVWLYVLVSYTIKWINMLTFAVTAESAGEYLYYPGVDYNNTHIPQEVLRCSTLNGTYYANIVIVSYK